MRSPISRRDALQRVEEEVWMKLRGQRFEARLAQLGPEPGRLKLALAVTAAEFQSVNERDHRPERQALGQQT